MMNAVITPQILVIQKISSVLIHERDVESMLGKVLSIIESDMHMLRGTFALLYGDTLRIEVSQGMDEKSRQRGRYRIGEGITGHVAETGRSHVIPDLRNDPRFLNRTGTRHYDSQVAFICVPLLHHERVIGTLSIDRPVTEDTVLESDVVYVLFTGSDWCPYCVKLQKNVLSQDAFKKFAADNLVLVYIDFPRRSKADDPAANKALAEKYGVKGFPTAKVMTPEGKVVTEIVGTPPEKVYLKKLTSALVKVRKQ